MKKYCEVLSSVKKLSITCGLTFHAVGRYTSVSCLGEISSHTGKMQNKKKSSYKVEMSCFTVFCVCTAFLPEKKFSPWLESHEQALHLGSHCIHTNKNIAKQSYSSQKKFLSLLLEYQVSMKLFVTPFLQRSRPANATKGHTIKVLSS